MISGIYLFRDIPIQRSAFFGIDVKEIQPDLARSGHMDLSSRIKWVHANLYEILCSHFACVNPLASLNALPFAPNVFDFVRIRYIGLAVPEDKVQSFMLHN